MMIVYRNQYDCSFKGQHFSELEKTNQCSLREAIQHKNKNMVEYLIKNGTLVNDNSIHDSFNSPLHLGVISRSLGIIKLLLDAGANINLKNSTGDTPLTLAAKIGNVMMIDLLMSYDVLNGLDLFTGLSHLHVACMRNKTDIVRKLLLSSQGTNTLCHYPIKKNSPFWAGYTPLHLAVHYGCLETVDLLLKYGADITAQDARQMTPLHLADFQRNEEIIDLILAAHKHVFKNPSDTQGLSHFHIACTRNSPSIVEHFLKLGMDVNLEVNNSSPWYAWRPIDFAIYYECPDVVKLLLKTNIYLQSPSLFTLLKASLRMGNRQIYDLLLSVRNTEVLKICKKYDELTDFHKACIEDDTENIERLFSSENAAVLSILDDPIWTGHTAAHLAVQHNSVNVVKLLLDKGANFTVQDAEGKTPLHIAFYHRRIYIVDKIIENLNNAVRNLTDSTGLSIFHILCSRENVQAVAKFLSHRIDINAQVGCKSVLWAGFTPMHFAVQFLQRDVIILLLKSGVNISIQNKWNSNPLQLLIDKLNVPSSSPYNRELIIEIFLDISLSRTKEMEELNITAISPLLAMCMSETRDPATRHHYLDSQSNDKINQTTDWPNSRQRNKCSALHLSMQQGLFDTAKLLMEKGADPLATNSYGQTPLECATFCSGNNRTFSDIESLFSLQTPIEIYKPSHFHLACLCGIASVVKYLLSKASDERLRMKFVSSINDDGATPLHTAIRRVGDPSSLNEIVHLLLENNADVDARDFQLQTPLHMMEHQDELEVMRTLISYGANVNAQNLYGQTALHLIFKSGCKNNKTRLVLLLENGADINILDEKGRSCLSTKFIIRRSDIDDYRDVDGFFVTLLKHVSKLLVIGFSINDVNQEAYATLLEARRGSFDEAAFICECQKELQSMMNIKIDSRTTLHDVIFKSPNKMVSYSNNVVLQKLVNSREFFERFPTYGYLIALQFERGKNRGPLLTECVRSFPGLSRKVIPSICLDTIFQYLSNSDLRNIALTMKNLSEKIEQ